MKKKHENQGITLLYVKSYLVWWIEGKFLLVALALLAFNHCILLGRAQ